MTDESAVVRIMTKLETLTHRKNHGPHWSESPTPSSAASPCVPEVNPCGVSGLWTFR